MGGIWRERRGLAAVGLCWVLLLNGPVLHSSQEDGGLAPALRSLNSAASDAVRLGILDPDSLALLSAALEDYPRLVGSEMESEERQRYGDALRERLRSLSVTAQVGFEQWIERARRIDDPRASGLVGLMEAAQEKCAGGSSEDFGEELEAGLDRLHAGQRWEAIGSSNLDSTVVCLEAVNTALARGDDVYAVLQDALATVERDIEALEKKCANTEGTESSTCEGEVEGKKKQRDKLADTIEEVEELRRETQSRGGRFCFKCILMALCVIPCAHIALVLGGEDAAEDYFEEAGLTGRRTVVFLDRETGEQRTFQPEHFEKPDPRFSAERIERGLREVSYSGGSPDGPVVLFYRTDNELVLYLGSAENPLARIAWDCDSDGDGGNIEVLENREDVQCVGDLVNMAFEGAIVDESDTIETSGGVGSRNRFQFRGRAETERGAPVRFAITETDLGENVFRLTIEERR